MSARVQADAALGDQIRAIHDRSRGTYGAPCVHAEFAVLDVLSAFSFLLMRPIKAFPYPQIAAR